MNQVKKYITIHVINMNKFSSLSFFSYSFLHKKKNKM